MTVLAASRRRQEQDSEKGLGSRRHKPKIELARREQLARVSIGQLMAKT